MSNIYCGNNRLDESLRDGSKRIGNRFECFQKGIGIGLHLPFDRKYAQPYSPISNVKIWCGKGNTRPREYDRIGTNTECLRKGVGVGKKQKMQRYLPKNNKQKNRGRSRQRGSQRDRNRNRTPRKKTPKKRS